MSAPSGTRSFPWHTLLIGALTVLLVWLFMRSIDPRETWAALRQARLGLIAAAIVVTIQTYLIRAWRWQVLLRPIGRARFRTAFRTTVIGFTASFLLPARVGEVLRPYLLARHDQLNAASAFATIVVERLLDMVTVLLMFGLAILLLGTAVGAEIRAAGLAAGLGSVVRTAVLIVLAGHPERLAQFVERMARWLPARLATVLVGFSRTFVHGLGVLRSPRYLLLAFAWSIPLWLSIGLGVWLTTLAFGLTLPFVGALFVVGYLAVGVLAPTPGGAGGFHYMYKLAMTGTFGAPDSAAIVAAIVLHAVSFVPITAIGLFYMWQDGLTLSGLKQMRSTAVAAEQPRLADEGDLP
jgi:glycosyltransferase 2 family protein